MEIKRNESTRNRPEGDRVLDAPYVFADLPAFINQVKDEKSWGKNDRNAITVFKSDNMTIVVSALKQGAAIKDNTVEGFITIHVLDGQVDITTPGGDINAVEDNLVTFHRGVAHSISAKTDAVILITTYDVQSVDI
jgi:quercetin dioxygenase-like cupin family protein